MGVLGAPVLKPSVSVWGRCRFLLSGVVGAILVIREEVRRMTAGPDTGTEEVDESVENKHSLCQAMVDSLELLAYSALTLLDLLEDVGLSLDLTLDVTELAEDDDLRRVRDARGVFLRALLSLSASRASSVMLRNGAIFSLLLSSRLSEGSTSELHPPYLERKEEEAPSSSSEESEPSAAALGRRGPKEVPRRVREGATDVGAEEFVVWAVVDLLQEEDELEVHLTLDMEVIVLALKTEGEETARFIDVERPLRSREMADGEGRAGAMADALVTRCLGAQMSSSWFWS